MPRLMGAELYGGEDPEELQKWCGQEATVARITQHNDSIWMVDIEEDENACFYMEEIDCTVDDAEIEESEELLSVLIGVIE